MDRKRFYDFSVRGRRYWFDTFNGEIKENISEIPLKETKSHVVRRHIEITPEDWFGGHVLNKMSLSISHTCNLCCSYCFADAGTYGAKSKMDMKTVKDSIDYFFRYASTKVQRYNVNFIGGEPLTNLEVFYFAVDYINQESKKIGIPVRYMITTNGTIMNEKILRYLIDNDIHINFSIDGNRKIQNLNRKNKEGVGSFEKAMETLELLKQHNYYNMSARMTVTKPGITTLVEDINFLWDIGFYYIFMDMVKTDIRELAFDNTTLKEFKEKLVSLINSEIYISRMKQGKYIRNFLDMEYLIENKIIKRECSYYNANSLEFTPEGDLYKCTYTVGKEEHCCGNIYSRLEWNKYVGKFHAPFKCTKCWCRRICGGGCEINRDGLSCAYTRIMTECMLMHYVVEKECNEK